MSMHMLAHISMHMPAHRSMHMPMHMPARLSIHMSLRMSIQMSIHKRLAPCDMPHRLPQRETKHVLVVPVGHLVHDYDDSYNHKKRSWMPAPTGTTASTNLNLVNVLV